MIPIINISIQFPNNDKFPYLSHKLASELANTNINNLQELRQLLDVWFNEMLIKEIIE